MNSMTAKYLKPFLHFFSAIFIVRFINLIRQVFLAWWVGPSKILDVFFFIISFPTLLNSTWTRALETALLSRYEKYKHQNNVKFANTFLSKSVQSFFLISFLIYLLVSILFPIAIYLFYIEYVTSNTVTAVFLINTFFLVETYLISVRIIKYSDKKFFLPSILPIFQSISLVAGIILFSNQISLLVLSVAYSIGTIFQLVVFFRNEFKDIKFNRNGIGIKRVRGILKNSFQLSIASGLSSLNLFIDQNFALNLGEGANSHIHYGHYFLTIFVALFVRNINTIFFPQFQQYVVQNDHDQLKYDASKVIRLIVIFSMSITILLINNGYFLTDLILGYGKMTSQDLEIIYYCMLGYTGAFLGTALNAVLVRILHVYYEYQIVLYVAIVNFLVHLILNFILIYFFGIWGIAVSTSVTFILICIIYIVFLSRKYQMNFFKFDWILRGLSALSLFVIFEYFIIFRLNGFMRSDFYWNLLCFLASLLVVVGVFYIFGLIRIRKFRLIY